MISIAQYILEAKICMLIDPYPKVSGVEKLYCIEVCTYYGYSSVFCVLKELLVSQVTQLEKQTIRLKEEAIKSNKEYSSISEELSKTEQLLEVNQSQLSEAHSELDVIKEELISHKQAVESFQQEAGFRLDAKLKEQKSNLEEEFQASLATLLEEKSKTENELRNEIEQVSSQKRNFEVCSAM